MEINQDIKKSIQNILALKSNKETKLETTKLPEIILELKSNSPSVPSVPPVNTSPLVHPVHAVHPVPAVPAVSPITTISSIESTILRVDPDASTRINIHPFLKASPQPPNNGLIVESIDQLFERSIDYNQLLIDNLIIKNPAKELQFDFSNFSQLLMQSNINVQNNNEVNIPNTSEVSIPGNSELNISNLNYTNIPNIPEVNTKRDIDISIQNKSYTNIQIGLEITQSWSILDIITKKPPLSWTPVFNDCYTDLIRINEYLSNLERSGKCWYPLKKDLFRAFELTPLDQVRVVIIGQDPYPGTNNLTGLPVAHGLAFSTNRSNHIPASLASIYRLLQKTVSGWKYPDHGDLSAWAKQGVLLLNKCLTLEPGESGSHKNLWSELITRTIQHIDKVNPNCIYVLWGNHAQQLAGLTTSKNVLMSSHPSPQGARHGFNDCNHFNIINELLVKQGSKPIDWSIN